MAAVSVFLIRGIAAVIRLFPYSALSRLGAAFGWFMGRIIRHRRRLALDALARCLPERTPGERARIADGMYRHLATLALECLYFSGQHAKTFVHYLDIVGREHVEAVRARGGGALALMGHIGNWELMGLAAATLWNPISVVVKTMGDKSVNNYWKASREKMGLRLLPSADAARDCLKALRRKEAVALILDQNMRRHRGIFVDFFGQPANTTPGLAVLSAVSRTPVVPAYMIRKENGRHELRILPPIEPPADRSEESIHAATQRYTKTLEDIIRAHPAQWTWLHKRWRTKPEPTSPAAPA